MPGQVYIHRAVIVPGAKRSRVFSSIEEAPAKVREVFENGSVVTIVIADRRAQERIGQIRSQPPGRSHATVSTRLVSETLTAIALIGTVFYFALSR